MKFIILSRFTTIQSVAKALAFFCVPITVKQIFLMASQCFSAYHAVIKQQKILRLLKFVKRFLVSKSIIFRFLKVPSGYFEVCFGLAKNRDL